MPRRAKRAARIDRLMPCLTEHQRGILTYMLDNNCATYADVAAGLGITIKNVDNALYMATSRLRKQVQARNVALAPAPNQ